MSGALPVARRLLLGLRGDRRTLALVFVMPAFVVFLLSEVFPQPEGIAHILLGVVVFFLTYLLTAIGFLRERTAGTLERVLIAPVSRSGLVLGYVFGFGVLAAVQSLILLGSAMYFLGVEFEHGIGLVILIELLGALTALGIGIVLSLFAESEFQAIQFIPTVITPQVILGGTFRPVDQLVWYLEYPARVMPITYLIQGMEYAVLGRGDSGDLWAAITALTLFTLLSVALATVAVRRAS